MGAKDSKPTFISYEDAVKRVSDSELRRIREAFKRCAGANGTALSLEAFVHDVLCDGVPYEVAEWLYQTCGGTRRGIVFKDLLCGIVVLTKGNIEEKIKFLWTLYTNNQGDNGTHIYKRDFARTLHLENTSLPVTGAQHTAEILLSLFGQGDRVTFDQFRSWLLIHKDATVLSKWLLSGMNVSQELETPTFYQSLAGVTHLEERDIIELEKCFWSLRTSAPTGQLDAESLGALLSPPLPSAALAGTFLAFDENRDGHVDFKELCCGLSAACRGPTTERLKFCFKIFDLDSDGVLNKKELIDMVGILCTVANESLKNQDSRASTPDGNEPEIIDKGFDPEVILINLREKLVTVPRNGKKPVFQLGPNSDTDEIVQLKEETKEEEKEGLIANDTVLTLEDFLIWSVESAEALVTPFSELLFEVCHIVLGLRPQCKHKERDIVLGWLRREVQRGYAVGQFWYLVAAEWWAQWGAYTLGSGADTCCRPHHRHIDEAIVCDESFTTNSTESMGSLVWRAETGSVGSAGSSSGVSSAAAPPARAPHPGPVHNKRLLAHSQHKVSTLTGEGGHLRRDVMLAQHRDFELVPEALWRALALWYGGPDPLPRQVIRPPNSDVELELYPLQLHIYRHLPNTQRAPAGASAGAGAGAGAGADTQLAYTGAFSRLATVRQVSEFLCGAVGAAREDVRLWAAGGARVLLDDDRPTLQELGLGVGERARLLLELRNPDLTWPEEIGALANSNRGTERRDTLTVPNMPGATGLHNLGNTCFMNAALQAVWNTGPLTRYFNSGMHLYEVNPRNPLGTGGALALRFGELCKEVWSCSARSVAPLRVRWCVSRHARALAGGGQHDAQELLAWLLDALHEDLNRAAVPPAPAPAPPLASPPPPAPAPAPRPDRELAAEAWEQHRARNDSILTELFYGQLKSKVRCDACQHESVRFDAFNMLSLPLPMECFQRCEIRVMLLDGSVPVKYGVRINSEGTYSDLKKKLSELCGLAPESMVLAEVSGAGTARLLDDAGKVSPSPFPSPASAPAPSPACDLYAYELPAEPEPEPEPDADCSDCDCACDCACADRHHANGWCEEASQWAEVSVGRGGNTSSLCMPALFCFKRSRSEILMSQSPPNTFYGKEKLSGVGDLRSSTLPRDLRAPPPPPGPGGAGGSQGGTRGGGMGSPTLSVKSLTLKPTSPRLGKVKFGSSPSNMYKMNYTKETSIPNGKIQYLVAVHRKQHRAEWHFLPAQRSGTSLFGVPVVVPLRDGWSGRRLYALVWRLVARLLTARPPQPPRDHNHAADCDDSLGYEFPFRLRVVQGSGAWCALCPWPALCRGCALPDDDRPLVRSCSTSGKLTRPRKQSKVAEESSLPDQDSPVAKSRLLRQSVGRLQGCGEVEGGGGGSVRTLELGALRERMRAGARVMLAIDWDPTALHLRYQSTREKEWTEHRSVGASRAEAARAVDLASCLRAFTREERLEQRYHCERCRAAQPATKKLQIWRLPPVLVIHLKRFQYVNNKWIKSQKVVNFPFQEFDPTAYLASVPQETILHHLGFRGDAASDAEQGEEYEEGAQKQETRRVKANSQRRRRSSSSSGGSGGSARRQRLESTSLVTTPVTDDNLEDYHQHRLLPHQDQFHLKYNLYAVVSHSGQLSGGHYVAYARNPSGAWLCYNDSSCRELCAAPPDPPDPAPHGPPASAPPDPPIDPAAAYLLFYERRGLDYERYLPEVRGRAPPALAPDLHLDPDENDLRKMCVLV